MGFLFYRDGTMKCLWSALIATVLGFIGGFLSMRSSGNFDSAAVVIGSIVALVALLVSLNWGALSSLDVMRLDKETGLPTGSALVLALRRGLILCSPLATVPRILESVSASSNPHAAHYVFFFFAFSYGWLCYVVGYCEAARLVEGSRGSNGENQTPPPSRT